MLREVDVCVVGGGAAGIAAACSAARAGAKVLLIERYGFLGGQGTSAIIGTFCGLYTSGAAPRPLRTAVGWSVVRELLQAGAAYRFPFGRTQLVHYDAEVLKLVYDRLVRDWGVEVFLHAICVAVEVRDRRVTMIEVHTRGGAMTIHAGMFVDCTGDADVVHLAGGPTRLGDDAGRLQPATAVFRMGGVSVDRALAITRAALSELMQRDIDDGTAILSRASGSFYPTTHQGEVVVNMTRVHDVNGVDAESITAGEQAGRAQIWTYAAWLRRRVPGFESAFVSAIGTQLGLRETRRIVGRTSLSADDLRSGCRSDRDLGEGAWPFETHHAGATHTTLEWLGDHVVYHVPLGATEPAEIDNVLVAGRCISTSSGAHASTRVMGTCFTVGEGVGAVAAWRARRKVGNAIWSDTALDVLRHARDEITEPGDWPTTIPGSC